MSRLSGKIYFFPAVLPLLAVVPWLLTAFGTLAGFVAGLLAKKGGRKIFAVVLAMSFVSLGAAAYLFWPKVTLKYVDDGSRLRPADRLPTTETLGSTAGETEPPTPTGAAWDTWKPLWTTATPRRSLSDVVYALDLVISGTWEGTVDAYSATTGKPVWSVKKKEPVIALTPGVDVVFAGEGVHTSEISALTAINAADGKVRWSREFNGHLESAGYLGRTGSQELLYMGAGPAGFYCLRTGNGEILWKRAGLHVDSRPLVIEDTVYFAGQEVEGADKSIFLALDSLTGVEKWRLELPGMPWGSPLYDAGREQILITSGVGQIGIRRDTDKGWAHSISLKDHRIRWTRPLSGMPLEKSIFFAGPDLFLVTTTNGETVALRAENGSVAWDEKLDADIVADLALDLRNGRVLSLDVNGKLRVRNALTGAYIDEHTFSPGANSGPSPRDDGIVLALPRTISRYRW